MKRKLILCLIALFGIQPILAGLPLPAGLPVVGGLTLPLRPGSAFADNTQLGVQSYYSMWSQQLTPSMRLSFNLNTANFVIQNTDMQLPGVGLPLTISRTWNSADGLGQFGEFTLDATSDVYLQFYSGGINFFGPTGYSHQFVQNPDGTYATPAGIDATLVYNVDLQNPYVLTFNQSQLQYQFDLNGHLAAQVDRSGNQILYTYSGNPGVNGTAKLISIRDTQGRTTTFTYDSASRITQITDPAGRVYSYGYNSQNTILTSYTDPMGGVTTYSFANRNTQNQITDPKGNVTQFGLQTGTTNTYFVTRVTSGSPCASPGCTWTFIPTYNSSTGLTTTTVTDPNGHTSTDTIDSLGRTTAATDPENHQTQESWTSDNHLTQEILASGATTTGTYDSSNNLTQESLPTNATRRCYYGVSGVTGGSYLPYKCTDPQGNSTSYAYNTQGLVTKVTDANGKFTSYAY